MIPPRALTVLIVDDDAVDRLAIERALLACDLGPIVFVTATSAAEALHELAGREVDLVFLDYQLPGHDGLWLLRELRGRGHDVPVVALTGQGDEQVAVALMKAGAADYIAKAAATADDSVGRAARNVLRLHAAESDARRALAELHKSEERLRFALDSAELGAWDYDLVNGVITWDERCRQMFGSSTELQVDYESFLSLIHADDRSRVADEVRRVLDAKVSGRYEVVCRVADAAASGERWLRATGRVVFQGETPVRFIGIAQDITEDHRAEQEARRHAEFEQQLVGIVSHDLRNPIAAMTMSASLLLKRPDVDPFAAKVLARIHSSGERATRMIHDLLDLTQARVIGGIPVERRAVDFDRVVRQTLDEVQLGFPDRSIVYRHEGDGEGWWDPDRLAQIVTNLVVNALTYGRPGSAIEVTCEGRPDSVTFMVHNGGDPIPPDMLANLFRPFQRTRDGRGSDRSVGLGLFIVKELVAAHQGEVTVDSRTGAGTTFRVLLPRRAAAAP